MRIISGLFKGRQLKSFKADHIRPTMDRMKETIFNILMGDIPGARVLDLFSGTGNLGIEALSRGATYIELVESNRTSLKIISENLKLLKIEKAARVVAQDVFRYLKSYKGEPFQVILIDPPFTEKWAHQVMQTIENSGVAGNGTLVVIESGRQEQLEDQYGAFQLLDRREFGDKSASFFVKREG
jgi:16S rRNA (guanine966-N2)-methyltransferase